jgi:hypothetical protein
VTLPAPRTDVGIGHLGRWGRDPLGLIEEGARLGPVFKLKLWRRTTLGYSPAWNRFVLGDLETFRSKRRLTAGSTSASGRWTRWWGPPSSGGAPSISAWVLGVARRGLASPSFVVTHRARQDLLGGIGGMFALLIPEGKPVTGTVTHLRYRVAKP